jgi:site-specific recombinase XerD
VAVHLFFADWAAVRSSGSDVVVGAGLERKILDGTAILLDGFMRPLEPWCQFLRQYAVTVSEVSVRAYARDALRFARFLDGRGVRVEDVTQDDLVAYRSARRARQIAETTWRRELVVIRALFSYLIETGLRAGVPWIEVGRWSFVRPRPVHTEMQVRALTREQWLAFKGVGVGGQRPDGSMDGSYRGRSATRDTAAVELAITTGMRLQEWRSLLDVEVRADPGQGATVELQVAAKNQRLRTVYVPASTVGAIELYRATERRRLILQAQAALRARASRGELAVVDEIDSAAGKLIYTFGGSEYRLRYRQVPLGHRRALAREVDGVWEPLSLWVGRSGTAPSQRSWHERFARANRRLQAFAGDLPAMPAAITPHDLRHSFAVVLLRSLQRRAFEHEKHRQPIGTGTASEHLVFNPLLTLQRLLGHASPATALTYLRFVDDSMELVQRAFESWGDESKDYADYVAENLDGGAWW